MTNHPPSEELFAYRDGELDREKRGLIEAHVLSCTACRTRLEDMSDAEGALRQELGDPDDAYFETMTRSVMGRVAPGAPERAGERVKKAPAAKGGPRQAAAPPIPTPPADGATSGARRPSRDRHPDDVHRGRAPGLPWPAIASAISAAAAVLVVAVILFRSPQAWLHAPKPEVVGLRREAPPEAPLQASPPAGTAAPSEPQNSKDVPTTNAPPADSRAPASQESKKDAANSLGSGNVAPLALSKQADEGEVRTQSADEALPESERQKERAAASKGVASTMQQFKSEAAPAPAPAASPAGDAAEGFGPLAARYGLPTLFDPDRVSHETLLRAEPEIRILYQTGRSGADSARVRLYLAEAARLRAGDSPDAETFDAIAHHYRRAVELARDPETARMARKRFEDFVSRTAPPR